MEGAEAATPPLLLLLLLRSPSSKEQQPLRLPRPQARRQRQQSRSRGTTAAAARRAREEEEEEEEDEEESRLPRLRLLLLLLLLLSAATRLLRWRSNGLIGEVKARAREREIREGIGERRKKNQVQQHPPKKLSVTSFFLLVSLSHSPRIRHQRSRLFDLPRPPSDARGPPPGGANRRRRGQSL